MSVEMQEFFYLISDIFYFFDDTRILGMSLTTWFVVVLVISAIGLFIRGNK